MQCRICESQGNHREYTVKEMMFGLRDEFVYFQCDNCGCLQIKDIPSDMSKYYPHDYYSLGIRLGRPENSIVRFVRQARNRYAVFDKGLIGKFAYDIFPHQALRSLSWLTLTRDLQILDVGCGSGNVLYSLKEFGFKNLLGIDPNIEKDICYSNGLKVLKTDINGISGKFDLIMFHHSFEHMSSPVKIAQTVNKLLSPGGLCVIRIPLADSWAWENHGTNWAQIDAPRHFFLHSKKSLELITTKAGLRTKEIVYDSTEAQFWSSEQYQADISLYAENSFAVHPSKSIFTKQQIRLFKQKAKVLNAKQIGDQAIFYLEKTSKETM